MPVQQLNVEFWFRLIYDCFHGGCSLGGNLSGLSRLATILWVWIGIAGLVLSAIGLAVIVYCLIRLFELRAKEHALYGHVELAHEKGPLNPRWAHIESLMGSTNPSDWRQAIIEADIMLDDMLTAQGYHGSGVGDKLKQVEPSDFDSLHDAWQAHDVRNQIAHQGSAYDLSHVLAQRTIGRYERVFTEFQAI
jgi:hypothetical protein